MGFLRAQGLAAFSGRCWLAPTGESPMELSDILTVLGYLAVVFLAARLFSRLGGGC